MKQITKIIFIVALSALSACDRSPAPEQPPAETAAADTQTTPAAEATSANLPLQAGQYTVDVAEDAIVIRANQINELVLFKAVANKGGFQLLAENLDWKTVSVNIHADILHTAVVELVGAYPYEIVHAPDETGQQEVLSEVVIGKPEPVTEKPGDKKEASDPGKEALLYIKAYDPLGQQQAYLEKLQDPTPEIRAAAAKEIMPTPENLPIMTDLLANDPSPEVRVAATWSLEVSEEAEAPQAIEALVKCLDDKDFTVVAACAETLGFLGDETTIVYLKPLLTHPDETVRNTALENIRYLE